jgi:anion-transporting  ArsA/GET3 family ATPase
VSVEHLKEALERKGGLELPAGEVPVLLRRSVVEAVLKELEQLKSQTPAQRALHEVSDALTEAVNKQEDQEWLKAEIAKIEADPRHHYEAALVQVNAPLALIQVELKARKQVLEEVLKRLG